MYLKSKLIEHKGQWDGLFQGYPDRLAVEMGKDVFTVKNLAHLKQKVLEKPFHIDLVVCLIIVDLGLNKPQGTNLGTHFGQALNNLWFLETLTA